MQPGQLLLSLRPSQQLKSPLDFKATSREQKDLVARPRPPLTRECLDAVKSLRSTAISTEAVIAAARLLGQYPESAAPYAEALAQHFLKHSTDVRAVIAYALGQIGAEAVAPYASTLVEGLNDNNPGVQLYLKKLLQNSGSEGAKELALKVASGDATSSASASAIITAMGSEGADALAAHLPQPTVVANLRIIGAMSRLKQFVSPHLEKLANLLGDKNVEIRRAVVAVLGDSGAAEFSDQIAALLEDEDSSVQLAALQSLGKMGKGAAGHTKEVADALLFPNRALQCAALKALGQIGKHSLNKNPLADFEPDSWNLPDSAIESVILHLRQKDCEMQSLTIEALKLMGGVGAAILSMQLACSDNRLRTHCCEALTKIGLEDNSNANKWQYREIHVGAACLACHLHHKDAKLRQIVCEGLGRCGKDARQYAIIMEEVMDNDKVAEVREAAKKGISQMGTSKGQESNALLTDPRLIAHAVPAQGRRNAQKMTELMIQEVQRIASLAGNSKAKLPKLGGRLCSCFSL